MTESRKILPHSKHSKTTTYLSLAAQQQHQQKLQKQQINTTVDVLWEKTLHLMKCMEDEDVQQDSFTRTHRQLLETTADDVDDANLLREMRMMGLGLLQKYQPNAFDI